jgi:hypothetical protein
MFKSLSVQKFFSLNVTVSSSPELPEQDITIKLLNH